MYGYGQVAARLSMDAQPALTAAAARNSVLGARVLLAGGRALELHDVTVGTHATGRSTTTATQGGSRCDRPRRYNVPARMGASHTTRLRARTISECVRLPACLPACLPGA
jgi:hypothetical protein